MKNLNAEQVKKALECFHQRILDTHLADDIREGEMMAILDALALINLQEQRIGELEKRLCYLLQSKTIAEYDEVDIHTKEYVKDIHSLDANIKELTEEPTHKETEYNEFYELLQTYKADSEAYRSYSKTLEKENEALKTLLDESFEVQNTVKVDTVSELHTRFAMRFGTYTDKDMTPIHEVFRLLDQIAKEMLEGEE